MTLGEKIRTLRMEKGMTEKQFAEKADLSINVITKCERGETQPRKKSLGKIASALGLSVEELFDGIDDSPAPIAGLPITPETAPEAASTEPAEPAPAPEAPAETAPVASETPAEPAPETPAEPVAPVEPVPVEPAEPAPVTKYVYGDSETDVQIHIDDVDVSLFQLVEQARQVAVLLGYSLSGQPEFEVDTAERVVSFHNDNASLSFKF